MKMQGAMFLVGALILTVSLAAVCDMTPPEGTAWKRVKRRETQFAMAEQPTCGKLNVIRSYYKLKDDGNSRYDWWLAVINLEMIPGCDIHGGDDDCQNYMLRFKSRLDTYHPYKLLEWYPKTCTAGSTSSGWTIGATLGAEVGEKPSIGAGLSLSYQTGQTTQAVAISSRSNTLRNFVHWHVDIAAGHTAAKSTYSLEVVFVLQVPQDRKLRIPWYATAKWMNYRGWDTVETLDIISGDDAAGEASS